MSDKKILSTGTGQLHDPAPEREGEIAAARESLEPEGHRQSGSVQPGTVGAHNGLTAGRDPQTLGGRTRQPDVGAPCVCGRYPDANCGGWCYVQSELTNWDVEKLRELLSVRSPILPPPDANGKRPRLFYWEEAENCWCPAETLTVENIIDVGQFISNGEVIEIMFKREDMTDAEFDALPEG